MIHDAVEKLVCRDSDWPGLITFVPVLIRRTHMQKTNKQTNKQKTTVRVHLHVQQVILYFSIEGCETKTNVITLAE